MKKLLTSCALTLFAAAFSSAHASVPATMKSATPRNLATSLSARTVESKALLQELRLSDPLLEASQGKCVCVISWSSECIAICSNAVSSAEGGDFSESANLMDDPRILNYRKNY